LFYVTTALSVDEPCVCKGIIEVTRVVSSSFPLVALSSAILSGINYLVVYAFALHCLEGKVHYLMGIPLLFGQQLLSPPF
jgi:hypothetical protein